MYYSDIDFAELPASNGFQPTRYWLRWRFEYRDRPPIVGMWNRQSDIQNEQAWCQPRNGLSRVMIEAKDLTTKQIKVVVDCPEYDYRNLQWIAFHHPRSGLSYHVGIQMLTRYQRIKVFGIGKIEVENLTEEDKKFHFATYGS